MSSDKVIVSGISGRYALALFDLALDAKSIDAVEADLNSLKVMLDESDDLQALVNSPIISRGEQSSAIAAIAKAADLSDLVARFLGVLASNRRLNALSLVIRDFAQLVSQHRGEVTAEVKSAHALSDAQLDELKSKLKAAVGRDVSIDANVDETLLGGLVVKVGSRMVDSSLKTKLDNLAIAMKGVG